MKITTVQAFQLWRVQEANCNYLLGYILSMCIFSSVFRPMLKQFKYFIVVFIEKECFCLGEKKKLTFVLCKLGSRGNCVVKHLLYKLTTSHCTQRKILFPLESCSQWIDQKQVTWPALSRSLEGLIPLPPPSTLHLCSDQWDHMTCDPNNLLWASL